MKTTLFRRTFGGEQKAFTLIEVLIASGILSFEILAVLAMFSTSAKTASFARRMTTASSISQSRIENAKNTPYANLSLLNGTQCFDRELLEVTCGGIESVYTRQTTVTADTPIAGMSQVLVLVSWKDGSGNTHGTELISGVSKF